MLAAMRPLRLSSWMLVAFPLLFLILFFRVVGFPSTLHSINRPFDVSAEDKGHAPRLARFWPELVDELVQSKPVADAVIVEGAPREEDMDPNAYNGEDLRVTDIIRISDGDREGLKISHQRFSMAVSKLALKMPFKKHSRGIVMTAGGAYLGMAITSLLMLRRTGSTLPVELFLDSPDEYNTRICRDDLPALNVKCVIMDDILASAPQPPKLKKYQYKVFSIIFSHFQEVLFLDADAWPVHNPDYLFESQPYRSNGLITWPDFWLPTVSPIFYDVVGLEYATVQSLTGTGSEQRSTESGIMLYDKTRHADSLLLAAYYNFYGPDYYYPLFSQGAHGQGDKETFFHAAVVLGRPVYSVRTHVGILGRWINGSFESAGMKQADPAEDYDLFASAGRGRRRRAGELGVTGASKPRSKDARTLFIHHNIVKVDIRRVESALKMAFRRNQKGKLLRLWGDEMKLAETSGYDVERAMWEEVIKADCESSWLEDCERLKEYYRNVLLT